MLYFINLCISVISKNPPDKTSTTPIPPPLSHDSKLQAFLGPLSPDFLRIQNQQSADYQTALALQQQQMYYPAAGAPQYISPQISGRLSITVVEAKLTKNYGITRMDPYVRLRIGHVVYETVTATNGGKNPIWSNAVIHCQMPVGVNTLRLQIYDECNFTMDELIAWTDILIPDGVFRGETHEDWYPLSGKQGDDQEGFINLVLSFSPSAGGQHQQPAGIVGSPMPIYLSSGQQYPPGGIIVTQTNTPPQPHRQQQTMPPVPAPVFNEADFEQIAEMFPNMEKDVVKSIYEVNRFNKDITINSLLQLSSPE